MKTFRTRQEADEYIREVDAERIRLLKQLTLEQRVAIVRFQILNNPDLTPYGRQKFLKELEDEYQAMKAS